MANGREAFAVRVQPDAPEERKRIRAVPIDAHGPMFQPIGMSHIELQKKVLEEVLKRKINTSARELARRVRLARLDAIKRFPLTQLGSVEVWGWINASAFSSFDVTEELGREMSRRISKPEHYHMPKRTKSALRWLFERKFPFKSADGCFIATASNSDAHIVEALLHKSGMRDHFRHIFTADGLGGIYKPSPEYFTTLINKANEAQAVLGKSPISADEFLFIGNSIVNDAPAVGVGMNVVILRDKSETLTEEQVAEYLGPVREEIIWADGWKDAQRKIDTRFIRAKSDE